MNLTPKQTKLLEKLQAARFAYDDENDRFEAAILQAREARKNQMRDLVSQAQDANIPERRIYIALGFSQPGPYRNFIMPPLGKFALGNTDLAAFLQTAQSEADKPSVVRIEWDAGSVSLGYHDQVDAYVNDKIDSIHASRAYGDGILHMDMQPMDDPEGYPYAALVNQAILDFYEDYFESNENHENIVFDGVLSHRSK